MRFDDLPLHDALLVEIHVRWETACCKLRLRPVGLRPHSLEFDGFSLIELPRRQSWGPSSSINTVRETNDGVFEIELQSGDTINIMASGWAFRPEEV